MKEITVSFKSKREKEREETKRGGEGQTDREGKRDRQIK